MQLIIAGKAHPADLAGQALIREWTQFIRNSEGSPPVVFIGDYDMLLAEHLVQGFDVWLNTPRRPWEACGTSGMKVLVNGGLNLSEMDGWWAEAYRPDVGWSLGDGQEHGDDPEWDAAEADALYERLEQEVIPEFYARDTDGRPVAWVARIRESMARLTPRFAATRAVCDYTERHYLPAAFAYRSRAAEQQASALQIVERQLDWRTKREAIRINTVTLETNGEHHVFGANIFLGDVSPETVRVDLYANGIGGGEPVKQEMTRLHHEGRLSGEHTYRATVPADRAPADYTVRIMPHAAGLAVPLEENWILWQK